MIPALGGCGRPAARRIEAYSLLNGQAHGSLDGSAYACTEHLPVFVDLFRAAGFTVYVLPGDIPPGTKRCGDGMDFTDPEYAVILAAPEPAETPEPDDGQEQSSGRPVSVVPLLLGGIASGHVTGSVSRATRGRAYELVNAGISAGLPLPMRVEAFAEGVLELRFDVGDRAAVDRWTERLGLKPARVRHSVDDATGEPWTVYRSRRRRHPALPGWSVAVGCRLPAPAPAPAAAVSQDTDHLPSWCVQGDLCTRDGVHTSRAVEVNLGGEPTWIRVWLEDIAEPAGPTVVVLEATIDGEPMSYDLPLGQARMLADRLRLLVADAGADA